MLELIVNISGVQKPTWITYNNSGNTRIDSNNRSAVQTVAKFVDRHYATWNKLPFNPDKKTGVNKGIGFGLLIAGFETVIASFLQYLERSPATLANLGTTLGELAQVLIANLIPDVDLNDVGSNQKEIKEKKIIFWKAVRENLVNGAIGLAGATGLYKWAKETFSVLKGEDVEVPNLSLFQKISLGAGSFLSALGMFAGYSEKCTFAPLAKEEYGGLRSKEMGANGRSDRRCTAEWLFMTAFPFLVEFKLPKAFIDFVLPLDAFLDGGGHFVGKYFMNNRKEDHEHNHECSHGLTGLAEKLLRKSFRINRKGERDLEIPKLFFNKMFLGDKEGNGLRRRILAPLYRLFGLNPLVCYMKGEKLMVKVPDQY